MIISKDFTFEASHVLPKHPGKCSRLHGHSWGLTVAVEGEVDPETGFVCDYASLKYIVQLYIIDKLDHSHLGAGEAIHEGLDSAMPPYFGWNFYPSSENLVIAIAKILSPLIQEINGVRLFEITLKETCTSAATYRVPAPEPIFTHRAIPGYISG